VAADVPPADQAAHLITALAAVLSAIAVPGVIGYALYLFRDQFGSILIAIRDKIHRSEVVSAEVSKDSLKVTLQDKVGQLVDQETKVARKVEAASARRLTERKQPQKRRGSRRS